LKCTADVADDSEIAELREGKAMADIEFEIKETLGVLSSSPKGWTKELNLVSWGGKDAKYDIRDWSPDHTKMSKGVTLTREELMALKEAIGSLPAQEE
jgi:hypothetical protein